MDENDRAVNMNGGYKNLSFIGTLEKILSSDTVFRGEELDAPDAVRVTRIMVQKPGGNGGACLEVFGRVPNRYLGACVRVLKSYEPLPNNHSKFHSQMFVNCDPKTFQGGEEIIDMTIRRNY